MSDELKRNELICSSKFSQREKEKLPKMKQAFSNVNVSEYDLQNLSPNFKYSAALSKFQNLESSLTNNESQGFDSFSKLNQLHYSDTVNNYSIKEVFDAISKIKKINAENNYFHYGCTSGLECSLDKMAINSILNNAIEVEGPLIFKKHDGLITNYLRNKRPIGKIPMEMFVECESESDENESISDPYNVTGALKVSKIKPQNAENVNRLIVSGTDKFGRSIQALLSQQNSGKCFICKFNVNGTVEICNGVEYFGQINFHDKYHIMSLSKSFYKLQLETGEFKCQLILKFARYTQAARLARLSDSSGLISQLKKSTTNVILSGSWQAWEHAGFNLLTDLSASTALEMPVDQLLAQGLELGAPEDLVESMRNMLNFLDTKNYSDADSLKILDIYKTLILPAFDKWYSGIRVESAKNSTAK